MLIQRINNILCNKLDIQCIKLIDSKDEHVVVYTLEEAFSWLCCHRRIPCTDEPDRTEEERATLRGRLFTVAKDYGLYQTVSELFAHISTFELPSNFKPALKFVATFDGLPSYGRLVRCDNKLISTKLIISKVGGLYTACEIVHDKTYNHWDVIYCLKQMATMPWLSEDTFRWNERWRALPLQRQVEIFDLQNSDCRMY